MAAKLLTILFLVATAFPLEGETILDNFDDNSLNLSMWQPLFINLNRQIPPDPVPGGSISEVTQRLEITGFGNEPGLPHSAVGDFFVGVALLGLFEGDFDVQVSYSLLADIDSIPWDTDPPVLGLVWGAGTVGTSGSDLHGLLRGSGLYAWDIGGAENSTPTSDRSGRLRAARVGSTHFVYYSNGGDWQLLQYAPGDTEPANFYLGVGGHGLVTVSVAFDDFQLRTGPLSGVPEPGSFALAAIALGLARFLKGRT